MTPIQKGRGSSSYLLGVKRAVLLSFKGFIFKWSTAGAVPFRVLSRKIMTGDIKLQHLLLKKIKIYDSIFIKFTPEWEVFEAIIFNTTLSMKVSKWVVLEMVPPRVKKFNATPTRKALRTSERFFSNIPTSTPVLFVRGLLPGVQPTTRNLLLNYRWAHIKEREREV